MGGEGMRGPTLLKVEEFNAKANTQSIQTADEVLGTLIDIKV